MLFSYYEWLSFACIYMLFTDQPIDAIFVDITSIFNSFMSVKLTKDIFKEH